MKKEIVISFIIIFCVIIGDFIIQNDTKKNIEIINTDLVAFKENIIKEKNDKLNNNIQGVRKHWDSIEPKLAFFIEHDELEKVETQISVIEGNMEGKRYKEILPEIEKCVFILEHIGDKTALNLKNIF